MLFPDLGELLTIQLDALQPPPRIEDNDESKQ